MDVDPNYKSAARRSVVLLTVLGACPAAGLWIPGGLSRMVGAEVMGLYQLVMPAFSVLLSLTAVGLTAAVSNLTSQYLAWENSRGAAQIVGSCLRWLILLILPVGAGVILLSDPISVYLLGDARTSWALCCWCLCCLTGVENIHKHFFLRSGAGGASGGGRAAGAAGAHGGGVGAAGPLSAPISGACGGPHRHRYGDL